MSRWYIDTSAAVKLLVDEAESAELAHTLDSQTPDLVACYLLETELRRFIQRDTALTQLMATTVLEAVGLYDVSRAIFTAAGLLAGNGLRSLDAIHLAAALHIGIDAIIAYDLRLIDAATHIGIPVHSPGQQSL